MEVDGGGGVSGDGGGGVPVEGHDGALMEGLVVAPQRRTIVHVQLFLAGVGHPRPPGDSEIGKAIDKSSGQPTDDDAISEENRYNVADIL